ncbi:unnamed protein product [Durusdinium trenchii]|uniref:Cyanate lyase C-terminal domain-containing protein n=2 Tax=Durusdinium trenchii TaxID=1381693 RepID=A0ABP0NFE1_9DINO
MVRMVVFLRLLPVAVVALYNTAFVGTEKQRRTVRRARTEARCVVIGEAAPRGEEEKAALVKRLLAAKRFSGKTFDEIAKELGYTNAYTANLFFNQAQLKERSAEKLKEWEGLAMLNRRDIEMMKQPPTRSFDPAILQEPNVYRLYEAIMHYGEAIKTLINEKCGDGIMSAIDFYLDVGTTVGKNGEKRVVITMNGKFLPHIEQLAEDNTAPSPQE